MNQVQRRTSSNNSTSTTITNIVPKTPVVANAASIINLRGVEIAQDCINKGHPYNIKNYSSIGKLRQLSSHKKKLLKFQIDYIKQLSENNLILKD